MRSQLPEELREVKWKLNVKLRAKINEKVENQTDLKCVYPSSTLYCTVQSPYSGIELLCGEDLGSDSRFQVCTGRAEALNKI